jgi:hypothetical protein
MSSGGENKCKMRNLESDELGQEENGTKKILCAKVKCSTNSVFSKPGVDFCVSALEIQILLTVRLVD